MLRLLGIVSSSVQVNLQGGWFTILRQQYYNIKLANLFSPINPVDHSEDTHPPLDKCWFKPSASEPMMVNDGPNVRLIEKLGPDMIIVVIGWSTIRLGPDWRTHQRVTGWGRSRERGLAPRSVLC